jgi:AcrR family transcriptional regulator
MCKDEFMPTASSRVRSTDDNRKRILDVSLEVLGQHPDAGMADIASAAGVVRRTVYGYFPTRDDLVRTLAQQAVDELSAVLDDVNASGGSAETVWVEFVARLWPLAHRYRVLLALRRGEYGEEIHALLGTVDQALANLVQQGQDSEVFGRHLPAQVLSQIAYAAVFAIADHRQSDASVDARAATMTSLLVLGVPEARAQVLVDRSAMAHPEGFEPPTF